MATGTTPSIRGNNYHLDAIIPRQIQSGATQVTQENGHARIVGAPSSMVFDVSRE
jgi:hypothetical protein